MVLYLRKKRFASDDPLNIRKNRVFASSLPLGSYTTTFLDDNGDEAWPTFAEQKFAPQQCSGSVSSMNVILKTPTTNTTQCRELIRNGDFEASKQDAIFWLHYESGGVQVRPGVGVARSNALSDMSQLTKIGALGQFLDTRCLIQGEQ